ncbi:MAG TPA: polysaccharide deacetylase family protein [Burkholderiales bacterium]|nr:polysaccharide deacetylase family protein [Burkholderiales bacterium]
MQKRSNPRIEFTLSSERPRYRPPSGKPLIVHFVVNIEYWPFDQPVPRTIVVPPHGRSHIPDLPNFCWSEYGNRCGMPRLLQLFNERNLPVSASINASVLEVYPSLAEQVLKSGWELLGHGIHQRSLGEEANERDLIHGALERLQAFSGVRPRGWMSPGWSETFDTPDLLREAGIEYVCQWVVDDLPSWLETKHGRLVAIPYGLDINDSVIYAIEKHSSPEMKLRIEQAVKTFEREIREQGRPRVLTISLHPHLSGVPHRINYLMEAVDALLSRSDTIFLNGSRILEWFRAESDH